jgi:hypothetical protein
MCYGLWGFRLLAVGLPQALLSGVLAVLVGFTAMRLAPKHQLLAFWLAGLGCLFNEMLARHTGAVIPVQLLLVLFWIAQIQVVDRQPKVLHFVVVFVALTLATFCQGSFFLITGAFVVWLLWRTLRGQGISYLITGVGLLLVIGTKAWLASLPPPQGIKDPVIEQTVGMLWVCNNPLYENIRIGQKWKLRSVDQTGRDLSHMQTQRYNDYLQRAGGDFKSAGKLYIKENPLQFAKLCMIRFLTCWVLPDGRNWRVMAISSFTWLLILPLGCWGLWRNRQSTHVHLAVLILLAAVFWSVFGWPAKRYRLVADTLLVVYAARVVADWIGAKLAAQKQREIMPV